jgi:hypothetical protein
MKKTTKKDKPNKLEKLVFHISEPLKMDMELTWGQIGLMVGQNDSGKTFVLKVAYALGAIGQLKGAPPNATSAAQFVLDNTFTDQNINGTLDAVFTKGRVSVVLEKGKVTNVEIQGQVVPAIFLSSDMRTFDQMALYLSVRKGAKGDPLTFMKKMLKPYRLYDVSYMEALLARMPLVIPDKIKSGLKGFDFKESIASITADTEKCEFVAVLDDGSKKNIATYGKGHQAMLNMMIGVGA